MINSAGFIGMRTSDAAFDLFAIDEARLGLANRVTGNETPEQLVAIHQVDKGLALKRAQAQLEYDYHSAWFEQRESMRKKARDQKRRLFDMGAIFA